MGQPLSRPVQNENQETRRSSTDAETDDRQEDEHTCEICNNINPYETTSLCESCQLAICQQCESPRSNYIICDSCNTDLYSHDDTLIECQHCGNLWDGHAQCNCYYEEYDDV